jgi:hypothetical protein
VRAAGDRALLDAAAADLQAFVAAWTHDGLRRSVGDEASEATT